MKSKMQLQQIQIKKVLNTDGDFAYLELWQGNNVVRVSLENSSIDTQRNTYKWDTLQELITKVKEGLKEK